jgi:hypothetical protein
MDKCRHGSPTFTSQLPKDYSGISMSCMCCDSTFPQGESDKVYKTGEVVQVYVFCPACAGATKDDALKNVDVVMVAHPAAAPIEAKPAVPVPPKLTKPFRKPP